jgi:protein-L-isoaspartate(D-aspartate) O-methyltransferase
MKCSYRLILFSFITIVFIDGCAQQKDFAALRAAMVQEQIKQRGVADKKVLAAMLKVERHLFVPLEFVGQAYNDHPVSIGEGQTISQPYIVAFMTDALKLKGDEKVLEIGTGSGYQAAILGGLCKEVYTIELYKSLAENSMKLLKSLNYTNVFVKHGDGYLGWPEQAPFDKIIVTCSPKDVPQPLIDQLKEGGTMIIPVGETFSQELWLMTKSKGKLKKESVMPVRFVPMKDEKGRRY